MGEMFMTVGRSLLLYVLKFKDLSEFTLLLSAWIKQSTLFSYRKALR